MSIGPQLKSKLLKIKSHDSIDDWKSEVEKKLRSSSKETSSIDFGGFHQVVQVSGDSFTYLSASVTFDLGEDPSYAEDSFLVSAGVLKPAIYAAGHSIEDISPQELEEVVDEIISTIDPESAYSRVA
ncbi:MAG: hypothetical protein EOP06_05550 [Proteobacteria bacterium]|nr:MAG: hypothetical protein EOP06_05550 [Pseudomonadota bacterium]